MVEQKKLNILCNQSHSHIIVKIYIFLNFKVIKINFLINLFLQKIENLILMI